MKRAISLLTCIALLPFITGAAFPFSFWKKISGSTSSVDTFFRGGGDVSPISNPMSDGVSTWQTTAVGLSLQIKIQSNTAKAVSTGDGLGRVATPAYGTSQTANIKDNGAGGPNSGPAVFIQSSSNSSCYLAYINSSTQVILQKQTDNGSTITRSTLATITTSAISATNLVGLGVTVSGGNASLTVYVDGAAQAAATVDSTSAYVSGQPGFYNGGNGGAVTAFSSSAP